VIKLSGRVNGVITCHNICWEVVASCSDLSVDEVGCVLVGLALDCGCCIISGVGVV